jgi:hypothetical protein
MRSAPPEAGALEPLNDRASREVVKIAREHAALSARDARGAHQAALVFEAFVRFRWLLVVLATGAALASSRLRVS